MKSLKELAIEVLAIQDACNMCGIAQSFAKAMIDLNKHTTSTDDRNNHPITRLWIDKFSSLAHMQSLSVDLSKDFELVTQLAERKE